MFLASILRVIKFAIQDFFRNFWLSFITISIVILTLFSVNVLTILQILTTQALSEVEEKIDLVLSFSPRAPQTDIERFREHFAGHPAVRDTAYVSADESLAAFRDKHKGDETLEGVLEQLEENPLGASLVIQTHDLAGYEQVLQDLEGSETLPLESVLTKDFRDHRELMSRIRMVTERVTQIGYAVIAVFLVITVLIMFNTIRVGIYTHREEIGVMKLVGASNMFVRAPFIIQAVWLSFLAFVISVLIWMPVLGVLQPYFAEFFASFDLVAFMLENGLSIFGYQFAILLLVNVLSATVAINRYLKV